MIRFSHDDHFNHLSHSTIEEWFVRTYDDSGNFNVCWVEKVLFKANQRDSMFSRPIGKDGILNDYPEIGVYLVKMLRSARSAGTAMTISVARVIILGIFAG
jgi:hypothetical protein